MYKKIILETNIHRVRSKPNNRIKGTRVYKYSHTIHKDFSRTTSTPLRSKTGFGCMTLQKSTPNYLLEILVASKGAGNIRHNN